MSRSSVASLTGNLLVAKGTAGPSCYALGEAGHGLTSLSSNLIPVARDRQRSDNRSRLTLRIDAVRHRRLRIAAAQFGKSGHALLVAALDHYLEQVVPTLIPGPCGCLGGAEEGSAVLAPHAP